MNKKGQILILFIFIIPILILVAFFVIDTGTILKEQIHLKNNTKTIIKSALNNNLTTDEITNLYHQNNIEISGLKISLEYKNNKINIKNNYEIESIFGNIIGIKHYNISIDITGFKENNKIKYE